MQRPTHAGRPLGGVFAPATDISALYRTIPPDVFAETPKPLRIIVKKITAYDSVLIDKKLQEIKETVDEFDNYWFMKNRESHLLDMIYEIENITNWIKEKCGYERD